MGSCASTRKKKVKKLIAIDKYKRRVHFARRVVVKVHEVKRNAGDSRKCIWYVPRTLEIQQKIDMECDALLGENKIHFRKIKDSIERQSVKRRVVDAIQESRSESIASRNKALDALDGVTLAVLALSKWNTATENMILKDEQEKKREYISSHTDKMSSSGKADKQ